MSWAEFSSVVHFMVMILCLCLCLWASHSKFCILYCKLWQLVAQGNLIINLSLVICNSPNNYTLAEFIPHLNDYFLVNLLRFLYPRKIWKHFASGHCNNLERELTILIYFQNIYEIRNMGKNFVYNWKKDFVKVEIKLLQGYMKVGLPNLVIPLQYHIEFLKQFFRLGIH